MEYSVQAKNVSKKYFSGEVEVDALINVSFSLKKGEFVAIVGPSGSGKSTLMHLLGTIDKPTSGEVYIDGVPTSNMNENQLANFRNKKLGFVFQAFNLVNGINAEMNVALPLMVDPMPDYERKERADALLNDLGLGNRVMLKPMQLSGGQQQRVAIARALVNNPSLVLADEPTGNLDSKAGDEVIALFRSICKKHGVTIVMVTHNPDITRKCDHVIHIMDGRMVKEEFLHKDA
jgi:putative ABC transport system ATP-binding protein